MNQKKHLSFSHFVGLFLLQLLTWGCVQHKQAQQLTPSYQTDNPTAFHFYYDLRKPDVTFELPKPLNEISGIALTPDEQELVAVQDEEGKLFYIDVQTGNLTNTIRFHKDGDYEDLAVVGDTIYVLRSSGKVYRLIPDSDSTFLRTKFEIGEKYQDMEGLCVDKNRHRLLVACKGELSKSEKYRLQKGMLAFDLQTLTVQTDPAFVLRLDAMKRYFLQTNTPNWQEDFKKIMNDDGGVLGFAPSAVGVHPLTQHIFVLSSRGKALVVLSQKGDILHIEKIDKSIHLQPEGLTFAQDGTLYISNEAKDQKATILRFEMQKSD